MNIDKSGDKSFVKQADELSEGNLYLKYTLVSMWENNITPLSFSAGNNDAEILPYISILIDNNSAAVINNIFEQAFKYLKDNVQLNYYSVKNTEENKYDFVLHISAKKYYANALFGLIYNTVTNSTKGKFEKNNDVAYIINLLNLMSKGGCCSRVALSLNKIFVTIGDELPYCNEDCPELRKCVNTLITHNSIEDGTYKANMGQIMQLVDFMLELQKGYQKRK
jgi:hypothetical protein